jgi:hypothetical protein
LLVDYETFLRILSCGACQGERKIHHNCGGSNLLMGIHPFGDFIETKVWHTTLNKTGDQKLLMY